MGDGQYLIGGIFMLVALVSLLFATALFAVAIGFVVVTGAREIGYRWFGKKTWKPSGIMRVLAMGFVLILCSLFGMWLVAPRPFRELEAPPQTEDTSVPVPWMANAPLDEPTLAVVYAPRYGYGYITGECRGGFNDSMHWGTFWGTVGEPEKGYYCCADPEVIEWQLDQLEGMGVEALFVSWWGWGDTDLDGDVEDHSDMYMNHGIKALLDEIKASNRNMKVAVIAEPFTLTQAGIHPNELRSAQKQMVLDWLWENYYDLYASQMFQWHGKPLLITFDPVRLPADPRYTIEAWTGRARDSITESEGYEWFFAPPQDIMEGMSDDGVAFVYPRFDEQYLVDVGAPWITWEPRRIDPYLTEGKYEEQWQKLVDNRDKVEMIVLYSWNVYGEQTQIEPSWGGPAPVGFDYVAKTKTYYEAFLEGSLIDP